MAAHTIFGYVDDEGFDVDVAAHWVVCDTCSGEGKHSHAVDGDGISSSEWEEWAPEEQESYMRGDYDRECEGCKGRGLVLDVDWDKLDEATRKRVEEARESIAESYRIQAAERRFGA